MIDLSRARDELGPLVVGALPDDEILDRYTRVLWNILTEPGDRAAGQLVGAVGPAEAFERVRRDDLGDGILDPDDADRRAHV